MGREEKEDIHETINKAVKSAMTPIYWMIGVPMLALMGIIITLTGPIMYDVSGLKSKVEQKANENFVTEKYLSKEQYTFLEEDQNKATVYVFRNPEQAEQTYSELNIRTGKQLGVNWRSSRQIN